MRKRGFTLLELIVVMVILSLSLLIVFPSIHHIQQSLEIRTTAKKISSFLRYYRNEAINKGKVYVVSLERDLGTLKIFSIESFSEEGTVEKKLLKNVTLPEGIYIKEVKAISVRFPLKEPSFEFYPEGGCSGGYLVLSGPTHKEFEVSLDFLTGSVEVKRI